MVARVLYYSGFTAGGEFEGPNNWSEVSTFEDMKLREVAWKMRDALIAQMHRKEHRNTPERMNTLHQAVKAYPYEVFKLPNILHAWETWKAAIVPETVIVLVHRSAELIAKSLEQLHKGQHHQDRLALVRWCEKRMDEIRNEMRYVIDIYYQDVLTAEGQETIRRRFLDYFPDRPLDFSSVVKERAA